MNVELPDPVPLHMPPGHVDALTDVVRDVAGAGYHLNVLAGSLPAPAAAAPGWLGDDAAAAVAQVGVAASLSRQAAEAVVAAMHRLSAHAECLSGARRRVAALEREQQEDFTATAVRLAQVPEARVAVMTQSSAWVGPLDDLRAAEESRRRRHAAVLEEVAGDAAATARVLADSCAAIGGRGARDDSARVLAHFAARLPGWGDSELAAHGRALAASLVDVWQHPREHDEMAGGVLALAGTPAFAEAFLLGLGEDGMRGVLELLGDGDFGAGSALPALMVRVLGAAGPAGFPDEVDAVVEGPYVDAADLGVHPDSIVLGMAVVLAAAASRRTGIGLPPATVAAWGRQIVQRESRQAASAIDRVNPMSLAHPEVDAVPLVVELLSGGDDSAAAARLLADRESWTVLLARTWDDRGADLARLVQLAGSESGRNGGAALRAGLEALGTGLDDRHLEGWSAEPRTATAVTRPMAEALAAHWAVPAGILAAGADGEATDADADRLRGLGFLTIDPRAASALADAVTTWVAHQPAVTDTVTTTDLVAVAVPAAFLGVQEYGQRLAHALKAVELHTAAEDREWRWNATVGLLAAFAGGRWNPAVGALEAVAARLCDADGSWDIEPDQGTVFQRGDAEAAARGQTLLRHPDDLAALTDQAGAAFEGTARALGRIRAPTPPSPGETWLETALDGAGAIGVGRRKDTPSPAETLTRLGGGGAGGGGS